MQTTDIIADIIKNLTEDWPEEAQRGRKQRKPARAQTWVDLSEISTI